MTRVTRVVPLSNGKVYLVYSPLVIDFS